MAHYWGMLGQELNRNHGEMLLTALFSGALSYLSHTAQANQPRDGIAGSGLGLSPKSIISQNNATG